MDIKQEKVILENTLKILRKGKFELSGDEAIVFHQCFSYLLEVLAKISAPVPTIVPAQTTTTIIETPKNEQPKTKKGR